MRAGRCRCTSPQRRMPEPPYACWSLPRPASLLLMRADGRHCTSPRYANAGTAAYALLAAGADRDTRDGTGATPLRAAEVQGADDARRMLASVRAKSPRSSVVWTKAIGVANRFLLAAWSREKVDRLCAAARKGTVDEVVACLETGVLLSVPDKNGWTPLHYAAAQSTKDAVAKVAALIDAGADPEVRAHPGLTALHVAAIYNANPDVLTLLLDRGAAIDADIDARAAGDSKGWTSLHIAVRLNKNPAVTTTLIDAGADTEARDATATGLHRLALRRRSLVKRSPDKSR